MTSWQIIEGDCREVMARMEPGSVQCCITSPPYFGLRDYGVDGQLGLEGSLTEYVEKLVAVFRDVRRVLRDDGTLWLNIGDTYAAKPRGSDNGWDKSRLSNPGRLQKAQAAAMRRSRGVNEAKEKDLLMVPAELALALRRDGWWLRAEIIWHKLTAMPDPVKDRPTRAHEQLYLLAKSKRYYYDADAIAEDAVSTKPSGNGYARPEQRSRNGLGQPHPPPDVGGKKNKRSVWTLSAQPYPGAHFATFPPKLIEPCVLAGSRPGDTVLDPCAGAGTTGLVALRHGRSFVGIEINPDYCSDARQRIRDDAPLLNVPAEAA